MPIDGRPFDPFGAVAAPYTSPEWQRVEERLAKEREEAARRRRVHEELVAGFGAWAQTQTPKPKRSSKKAPEVQPPRSAPIVTGVPRGAPVIALPGRAAELSRRFPLLRASELLDRKPPAWRIRGVLPARGVVFVVGESGSGKTHCVLSMSMAVALSRPWFGRRCKGGRVVIVNAEGDIALRVQAAVRRDAIDPDDLTELQVVDRAFCLTDDEEVNALIDRLQIEITHGFRIDVIVIDTLSRVLVGADENSSLDMGRAIAALQRIEQAFQCTVVVVHHLGKDKGRGPRGHSALYAAADSVLSIDRTGDVRTLQATKMRDGADGDSLLTFRLEVVDLGALAELDPESGADPDERVTSCVVVQADEESHCAPQPKPMGRVQRAVLDVLKAAGAPQSRAQLVQLLGQNGFTNRSGIYAAIDAHLRSGAVIEGLDRLYVPDA